VGHPFGHATFLTLTSIPRHHDHHHHHHHHHTTTLMYRQPMPLLLLLTIRSRISHSCSALSSWHSMHSYQSSQQAGLIATLAFRTCLHMRKPAVARGAAYWNEPDKSVSGGGGGSAKRGQATMIAPSRWGKERKERNRGRRGLA